ncbi:ABC transporter permease [Brevibacterium sp. 50QC2O2]|uniref:ABC transporter permease n=1 Tax=Brevibacterium sp. 50QC2O2 TaxID=2968459 RepID=UPI00211BFBB0|nr:ABC transporter permease [Brevibacterium sp. 50QC2O2]
MSTEMTTGSAHRLNRSRSRRSLLVRKFGKNKMAVAGAAIFLFMVLLALIGPLLAKDPMEIDPINRLAAPSAANWFGTDNYGRDVLSRVIAGARVSLLVGIVTALITGFIGGLLGLIAAYNRVADAIIMRICDGLMAFPAILLAIAIMAALGAKTSNVIIALSIVFTPYVARIVRSTALVVKEQTFVEALKAQGASLFRIICINIAPNILSPLVVQMTFIFADALITEAALSFLGAGVPPPAASWGNMLLDGKTLIFNSWWMTVFPGAFIMVTILAVNLLGDSLRDLLDPTHNKTRK